MKIKGAIMDKKFLTTGLKKQDSLIIVELTKKLKKARNTIRNLRKEMAELKTTLLDVQTERNKMVGRDNRFFNTESGNDC